MLDLLDCDVRFGQGFVFSPPRPVRAEALQGIAERADVAVRGPATAERPAGLARPADDVIAADAGAAKRSSGLAQLARRI